MRTAALVAVFKKKLNVSPLCCKINASTNLKYRQKDALSNREYSLWKSSHLEN